MSRDMKIRGVNLGNWLVLEKWMSQELFAGLPDDVADETAFYEVLPAAEAELRLHMHRSYYIQERDFKHIRAMGMNLVRIPVPHFIFGDCPPAIGCIAYLDQAFDWAERYGLRILIDLHTAPDGQNGLDNSGLTGVVKWHLKPQNIAFVLSVLERLAERYAGRKALYGIELLNEPISDELLAQLAPRYRPRHPEQAAGSQAVPTEVLKDFYMQGYETVRKYCGEETAVVIHDGFRLEEWEGFMPKEQYPGLVIDTHMYLFAIEHQMEERTLSAYETAIKEQFAQRLMRAQKYHPVIVGEWSLANKSEGLLNMPEEEKAEVYRRIGQWQRNAFEHCDGRIFWSYKLHAAGRSDWDYQRAVDSGYFCPS